VDLYALAKRIEVDTKELHIIGSKSTLLRILVTAQMTASGRKRRRVLAASNWRAAADEDGHECLAAAL
jgi:hypothetical protein